MTVTPVAKQPRASRSVRGSWPLRYSPFVVSTMPFAIAFSTVFSRRDSGGPLKREGESMKRAARVLATIGISAAAASIAAAAPPAADPNLYLEQIDGARALAKVRGWNAATLAVLEKQPGFADYRANALALLSTNQQIAEPDRILGDLLVGRKQRKRLGAIIGEAR